jgi:hypothetical protein
MPEDMSGADFEESCMSGSYVKVSRVRPVGFEIDVLERLINNDLGRSPWKSLFLVEWRSG